MSRVQITLLGLFVFLAFGAVGSADFADELDREAEEKLARPLRYYLIENSTRAADPAECRRALAHYIEGLDVVMTLNVSQDGIQWFRRTCMVAR